MASSPQTTKGELFHQWNKFSEALKSDPVMLPLLYKYYYPESHSPIPMIISERIVDVSKILCKLLAQVLPKITELYFKGDKIVVDTLLLDNRMHRLLSEIHHINPSHLMGSCRPDILIPQNCDDKDIPIKICEINARFSLNGFLYGGYLAKGMER